MSPSDGYAEPQRKSNNTWLYIILGVVLVVVLICGGIIFAIYRAITGAVDTLVDVVHQATVQVIRESDMEDDDKEKIVEQANRVAAAYKAGEIDNEQLTRIMENVFKGPIIIAGTCQHMERKYVEPSGLTEEEKEAGHLALERVARGAFEETISQQEFNSLVAPIQETDENGNQKLKDALTDEELQEFLTQAKQLADDHNIPEEPHEINIGEEVKKAVDEVLIKE